MADSSEEIEIIFRRKIKMQPNRQIVIPIAVIEAWNNISPTNIIITARKKDNDIIVTLDPIIEQSDSPPIEYQD